MNGVVISRRLSRCPNWTWHGNGFLARDIRHTRRVALKVLNPELGAVLGGLLHVGEASCVVSIMGGGRAG